MKRIVATFYSTEAGAEPVRQWLLNMAPADRKIVGTDIATVEFGWPISMPVCKPLRNEVLEVRSTIRAGKVEARTYFAIEKGVMLLLHGRTARSGRRKRSIWRLNAFAATADGTRLARNRRAGNMARKKIDVAPPTGGTLEEFLEELGEREEVYGEALKRVIAWQIETARKERVLSKSEMASKLGTSRTQVDRILDPRNVAVSLGTLDKAARAVGKRLKVEIVDI